MSHEVRDCAASDIYGYIDTFESQQQDDLHRVKTRVLSILCSVGEGSAWHLAEKARVSAFGGFQISVPGTKDSGATSSSSNSRPNSLARMTTSMRVNPLLLVAACKLQGRGVGPAITATQMSWHSISQYVSRLVVCSHGALTCAHPANIMRACFSLHRSAGTLQLAHLFGVA